MSEFAEIFAEILSQVDFAYIVSVAALLIAYTSKHAQELREAFLDEVRGVVEECDDKFVEQWCKWYEARLKKIIPDSDKTILELRVSHFRTTLYKGYRAAKYNIIRRVRKNGWLKKSGEDLDVYIKALNERDNDSAERNIRKNWSKNLLLIDADEFFGHITPSELESMGFQKYKAIIEEYKAYKKAVSCPINLNKALDIIYRKR